MGSESKERESISLMKPKACFTINQNRTPEEIATFGTLLSVHYQGIELFYPYDKTEDEKDTYAEVVSEILSLHPETERVLHLPFGKNNHLCDKSLYPLLEKRMMAAIAFAAKFACDRLTLHLGTVPIATSRKDAIAFLLGPLARLADEAAHFGMMLNIENMPGEQEIGYFPKELEEIISILKKPNIGVCFDSGHAHVARASLNECFACYGKYIQHVHLSDNHGTRDEHKTFGTGTIDFRDLAKRFKALHYDRLFCLEILYQDKADLLTNEALFRDRFN